ncbi:MAG TPA: hypothetical protein VGG02_03430 [Chthoniobacterales bacterium]|jgi:hypothetical protein
MKIFSLIIFLIAALGLATPVVRAQELDGSDLQKQLLERETKIGRLSLDEQLKLRAAETKAADDPAVKEALRKRDEAIVNFRKAVREAMIKADPTVAPILEKVALFNAPGS